MQNELIDWFTVIAQIINFIILVFLLRRFLYEPILKTMKKRQQTLEASWEEARERQREARQEAESYRKQQQTLGEQRQTAIAEARESAEQQRQALIRQAREEVAQQQRQWEKSLERQQQDFLEELQGRVKAETLAIARRVLQDLADAELEHQAIAIFLKRLQNLSPEEQKRLSESNGQGDRALVVRSHFPLSEAIRQQIVTALSDRHIANDSQIDFTTSPDLICGIELQSAERAIAWSFDEYLQTLDRRFASLLNSTQPNRETPTASS
ncbi:MAG: F0F1 ATP synthase subunit B [Cyanobacteriota bacterium]|nr:F0F1 ATP synthase subunit B [Cyanobacteriota bacterium]